MEKLGDEVPVREGQFQYLIDNIGKLVLAIEPQEPAGALGEPSLFEGEERVGAGHALLKEFPLVYKLGH